MQKKNAQSNGVVMRRGALPDKLASMRYDDKTWVKYSLTVPQENLRTNPDGSPELSKPEELMYERLVHRFGAQDVVRQYKSDRYPFLCNFYISLMDLYIELNYLVFWDTKLRDFDMWMSLDCPLGNDAVNQYSWLSLLEVK